jgi:hypothetical protein
MLGQIGDSCPCLLETGQIEHLCLTDLEIGEPSRSHGAGLLSSEAQQSTNRDELYCLALPQG